MSQETDTSGKAAHGKRDWDMDNSQAALSLSEGRGRPEEGKPSFTAARSIKRKLLEELCAGPKVNGSVHPEELLPRWPTDPKKDPDVASLLFEDFRQRRQRGEQPSIAEYHERFPEHKDSVANLIHHHDL